MGQLLLQSVNEKLPRWKLFTTTAVKIQILPFETNEALLGLCWDNEALHLPC